MIAIVTILLLWVAFGHVGLIIGLSLALAVLVLHGVL